MQRLEAITTCVNYGDFLREIIPFNLPHFDRWVIGTSPEDEETRELCRRYNLPCVLTEEHTRDGAAFNKGRLVQKLLDQISGADWICHIDADIVLPWHFRHALRQMCDLDPKCVYGCDRATVRGWEAWQKFKASGWLQGGAWDYHCRLTFPEGLPVGARWGNFRHGWCPIGFLQLWAHDSQYYRGIHAREYPQHHADASRSDVQFSISFDRKNRRLLPEIVVAHLESEAAPLGANWGGRRTKRFSGPGTTSPQQAQQHVVS